MRLKPLLILLMVASVSLLGAGCVKKTKIEIMRPGELKLSDVSKIAVLDFNTIKSAPGYGLFAADTATCELARSSVADLLYREPFYQLVDFDLEGKARGANPGAKLGTRLNALLYGKVWWRVSDQYLNFVPDKMPLESWYTVRYVCGRTDEGAPIYCTKRLTREVREEFFKRPYRAVTAQLMLGIAVYRITDNGRVEKVTQIFEIASRPAVIENGEFRQTLTVFNSQAAKDRAATLKTEESDFFGGLFGSGDVAEEKDFDEISLGETTTLPTPLESKALMLEEISSSLARLIAPQPEEFEILITSKDNKAVTLIWETAYAGLIKYSAEGKLAQGDPELAEYFYGVDFQGGAKEVVKREREREYAEDAPEEPYVPLTDEELAEEARSYLEDHIKDIYNLGLGYEALGDYERALEIYRSGFDQLAADQDFADGIGRCLFALDMADRISEEDIERIKAGEKDTL